MMQQKLDFNEKIMGIGTTGKPGMNLTRTSSRLTTETIRTKRGVRFLPISAPHSTATTLLFRIEGNCAGSSTHSAGLALVDCATSSAERDSGALYAAKSESGAILLLPAESPLITQQTLLGRVVSFLPGAKGLRYVHNVRLLEGRQRRRRIATA